MGTKQTKNKTEYLEPPEAEEMRKVFSVESSEITCPC